MWGSGVDGDVCLEGEKVARVVTANGKEGWGGVSFDAHFRFLDRNSLRRRVDLLGSVKGNELDCTRRIRAKLNVQHVAIDRLHL